MNFIAGMLLFHMGEENAFFTLDTMLSDEMYLPHDFFDPTLAGLHRNSFVLTELLQERYPLIYDHLDDKCVTSVLFTTKWFMKMFLGTLPMETSLRVWDSFFEEGFKVLYRIALTIMSICEKEILAAEDTYEIVEVINKACKEMYDCSTLLAHSFGIRNFSHKKISTLKEQYDWERNRRQTL
jgi:hypothetical protein